MAVVIHTGAELLAAIGEADQVATELLALYEFQGFNPSVTFEEMEKLRRTNPNILTKVIAFYVMRGTNITGKGATKEATEFIGQLATLGFKAKAETPKTLTLSRVAATYAALTASVIARNHRARVVDLKAAEAAQLPNYYAWPGAPAIIPSADIYAKWLVWAEQFDKTIHLKDQKQDLNRVKQFSDQAYNSSFYTAQDREKIKAICNAAALKRQ